MSRRWLGWGIAAAAFYITVVGLSSPHIPLRLLYDGEAPPPPYRWIHPPSNIPGPNLPPQAGTGTVPLTATGSHYSVVGTDDAQAWAVFPKDAVPPRSGESAVRVRITPLAATAVPPPPRGMRLDGNAYRIEAVYAKSEQPVRLRQPVTVMLRYPIHGTDIIHVSGSGWVVLPTDRVDVTLQLFAAVNELGIFAAASR